MEDEKALQLHKSYGPLLYRVAFSYVKSRADAEDAVQETYMRLLQKKPIFENEEHRKAWLLRAVINICKDILKSAWNNRTVGYEGVSEKEKASLDLPYGIEDETIWLVMELNEKYRTPLYLFYYEGYSIREISHFLNLPESTVKTHLKRGREILRGYLEQNETN